jgi:hypothetical protein
VEYLDKRKADRGGARRSCSRIGSRIGSRKLVVFSGKGYAVNCDFDGRLYRIVNGSCVMIEQFV